MSAVQEDEDFPKLFAIFFSLTFLLLLGAALCFFGKNCKKKCCPNKIATDPS